MKKYFIFIIVVSILSSVSMAAFSNNGSKKKKAKEINVKEKLEQTKKDPQTKDRAAKADVYIVNKKPRIKN